MISMKKNHELFWILEVLLLTPVAIFWAGVVCEILGGGNKIYMAVIGEDYTLLRLLFVLLLCPIAASFFAYEYIRENKKEKGATLNIAKAIIIVSLAAIAFVAIRFFSGNFNFV